MNDIYLFYGCPELPDLSDLASNFPELTDVAVRDRMTKRSPGFLGLDLPADVAATVLQRVQTTQARGLVVSAEYRQPKISIEIALPIAERAISQLRAKHAPGIAFSPVQYTRKHAMWWTFSAASDELIEQGYIPGALFASVDKLDGHIWQPEEMEQFFSGVAQMLVEASIT